MKVRLGGQVELTTAGTVETRMNRAAAVQRGLPAADSIGQCIRPPAFQCRHADPDTRHQVDRRTLRRQQPRHYPILYACPYRAIFCYPRPQRFRSYLGGNFFDTGGQHLSGRMKKDLKPLQLPTEEAGFGVRPPLAATYGTTSDQSFSGVIAKGGRKVGVSRSALLQRAYMRDC